MKKTLFFILTSFLLVACMEKENLYEQSEIIEISAGIEMTEEVLPDAKTTTRATFHPDGKGTFELEDQMALMVMPENALFKSYQLTLEQSRWTPSISWKEVEGKQASFVGFFPFINVNNTDPFTFALSTDQRKEGQYDQSDLLMARTTAQMGNPVVLNFKHVMSKIAVVLKTDGSYTSEQLAQAQVSMKAFHQMVINPADGSLGKVQGEAVPVYFEHKGAGQFQAVFCPQEILPEWKNEWLDIEIDGKHLRNKVPAELITGVPFERLESGKQITITLTLRKKQPEPEMDWRNKDVWVYGLKDMPSLDQWGLYSNDPYQGVPYPIPGLTWERKYGWYDCNKIDPTTSAFDDNNSCWAATCSNLLHWWLDQNAENIARYNQYDGPREYPDSYGSEIFQFYKKHFTNKGYFIQMGLRWFFLGEARDLGKGSAQLVDKSHHGFFKDVISSVDISAASSYDLTSTLKKVLLEKKAIGLEILLKASTAAHALTIWGAGFDENGEVDCLYIAENNDRFYQDQVTGPMRPGKLCSAGLYKHKVRREADGTYTMESSTPGAYTIIINTLIFLGANDEDWENYFRAHPEK